MSDVDRVRSIRIEALGDPVAHIAFLGSRERALAQPPEFWQERTAAVAFSDSAAQFVAESGRDWFGTVTVLIAEPTGSDDAAALSRPSLVAVYVRPSQRGRGVLEAMVDAAAAWAGDAGETELALALEVHEDNLRAQRAYARLGFVPTGRTSRGPNGAEHEMVRRL
jgi:GNAT superfamily N-acetyltransferase